MAWQMRARILESCSCRMICECTLGPAQPDQGWCSGAITVEVLDGESEGVDLSGAKLLLLADLQSDFMSGIDKALLVIDPACTDEQRRELEAIIHGKRGGLWAAMGEAIAEWLPSIEAEITIGDGDKPTVTIEGVGEILLDPIKTEDGTPATLQNAPLDSAGFGRDVLELARADGTRIAGPGMRSWESLGYGSTSVVEWSA